MLHTNVLLSSGPRSSREIAAVCGHASSKAHHSCTATIPPGQIIREYDMAFNIAQRLKSQGKAVTHLVSDSDAKGRDGFVDVNQTDPTLPVTTWYKEPSYFGLYMCLGSGTLHKAI